MSDGLLHEHGEKGMHDQVRPVTIRRGGKKEYASKLNLFLERERGITIKSHPVTMYYTARDGETYELNLIDTPGHVDFSYEVSRSLSACEGALLIIDAAQGVEAQTVANVHLALKQGLEILPVINKIDLPHADMDGAISQIEEILAIPGEEALPCSAKEGIGIEDILEAIVQRVPPPKPTAEGKLQALGYDSVYDPYKGVVIHVRVFDGELKPGMQVRLHHSEKTIEVKEVGSFNPKPYSREKLGPGETGYVTGNIRVPRDVKMGDTLLETRNAADPLDGFQEVRPMVYSGIYPINSADYEHLKNNLAKLQLNDPAFVYQQESSIALGFGFRCGFLGLLHLEIIQERLRREYDMDIIATYPNVIYRVIQTDGTELEVDNPVHMPDPSIIDWIEEPIVRTHIMCPNENIGDMMNLVSEKRGVVEHTESLDGTRVMLQGTVPMNEILVDFHDRIKSLTRGFGSMDYDPAGYQQSKMVKLDMLVNGDPVDAFSCIVHFDKAEQRGRALAAKLKEVIPRQQFKVAIQAAIGGRIVARETVGAVRKDVTAKCYGGDISRKRKLLEKQKEGKKRMKSIGSVNIPQDAFIKVLKA